MQKTFLPLLFALLAFLTLGSFAEAKIIYEADVETGNLDQFHSGTYGQIGRSLICCDHSAVPVTAPVRSGKYALKTEVRPNDPDMVGRRRAQVKNGGTISFPGDERWYAFSIYVPNDWVDKTPSSWFGLGGWHGAEGVGMSMRLEDGSWKLRHQTGDCKACANFENNVLWEKSVQPDKGKWTDFVFHVKWTSNKPDGFIELWKDGIKEIDYKGPVDLADSKGQYMQMGLQYDPEIPNLTRYLYWDEFKIGDENSSYDEVKPTGSANTNEPPSSTSSSSGGTYTPRFCHQTSNANQVPPTGFGSPFNLLSSAKNLILKAFCNTTTLDVTAGEASDLLYTYQEGYVTKNGSSWTKYTMTGESTQGDWIIGEATASIPMTASQQSTQNWLLSYSCAWTGSEWKCGCRTSDCTGSNGSMWQVQGIKR